QRLWSNGLETRHSRVRPLSSLLPLLLMHFLTMNGLKLFNKQFRGKHRFVLGVPLQIRSGERLAYFRVDGLEIVILLNPEDADDTILTLRLLGFAWPALLLP